MSRTSAKAAALPCVPLLASADTVSHSRCVDVLCMVHHLPRRIALVQHWTRAASIPLQIEVPVLEASSDLATWEASLHCQLSPACG